MPLMRLVFMGVVAAVCSAFLVACGGEDYEPVTGPSPFHGIHGIGFDADGTLLAGSVLGQAMYEIDPDSGESEIYIGAPEGEADDIALAPDGTLAWTGFLQGKVFIRRPGGDIEVVAEGLPGANSLAFNAEGRLFFTRVFLADELYEAYLDGRPPRRIMRNMGGLNGFEFGEDGYLYGPLWFKKQVARVDVERGQLRVIARGFQTPAAVNFGPQGNLWVVDTEAGEVIRMNINGRERKVVAKVKSSIDNLAFSEEGRLYISNMADNAIIEIDTETGNAKTITSGALSSAGDISSAPNSDDIYVADVFSLRKVNSRTGEVSEIERMFGGDLDYPTGVSASAELVAVAGATSGAVQIFDIASGRSLLLAHDFAMPHDVLILPDESVLVAEYGENRIVQLRVPGWTRKRVFATKLEGPVSLALGPDGNVYVAELAAGRISIIDMNTRRSSVFVEGLDKPEGMVFAPDGSLIVAESGLKQIVKLSPSGEKTVLAEDLPIGAPGSEAVPTGLLTGIALDTAGNILFSSDIDASLYKIPLEE